MLRARKSLVVPGENGTTKRIGFSGYAFAVPWDGVFVVANTGAAATNAMAKPMACGSGRCSVVTKIRLLIDCSVIVGG